MPWDDGLKGPARDIAVTDGSPLRVMAGPGTGKTYALMRRLARLLHEGQDPSRILLVTFTRVAALDLESELKRLRAPGASDVNKGTLHSFCFRTLLFANVLGLLRRVPRVLLKFERRFLLEDLSRDDFGSISDRDSRLNDFAAAWAREQDQAPGWPADETDRQFQGAMEEWLRFHEAMLLEELVPLTLKFLRSNPASPQRRQFDHVLVDEYQDLNRAEQALVDLLSEDGKLAIVGDEDQSIYESLRHAHPEGIASFHESHVPTFDIPLDLCRRCPKRVVTMAKELIRNNLRRTPRALEAMDDNCEGEIHVVQWQTLHEEVEGLADFIYARVQSGDFVTGKTLVLCPRRQLGYMIRDALRERGCAAHSFFYEEELEGRPNKAGECTAQEALTLLRLLAYPRDRVGLRCWLGFGSQNLRHTQYERLRELCASRQMHPADALDQVAKGTLKIPRTAKIRERYQALCDYRAQWEGSSAREVFDQIFPEADAWAEPFRAIADESVDEWTLPNVLDTLIADITQPELPSNVGYVRVMSLHKAKGLSADNVIVAGCVEGLIPTIKKDLAPSEQARRIEEQRRLFYVATSRCRRTLVLSSARSLPWSLVHKMGVEEYGGDQEGAWVIASTFLEELGPERPSAVAGWNWLY